MIVSTGGVYTMYLIQSVCAGHNRDKVERGYREIQDVLCMQRGT